jgi:hypothetical protein
VPNERTGVPGRKWLSGFFSIGSMQKPEELIGSEHDLIVGASAHEAQPALAFVEPAIARAEIALNAPIYERMPVAARQPLDAVLNHGGGHPSL